MLCSTVPAKFFGFPHVAAFDNLQFMSLLGARCVLEIGGGLLLLTWPVHAARGLSLSASRRSHFMAHAPQGFYPLLNQGELASLLLVFLYCRSPAAAPERGRARVLSPNAVGLAFAAAA